jgi:predicted flap endonuclease-1-like 5' DNA nuclease
MSAVKKNQQNYEALLKDYQQAQAQLTRTQLREKEAKKSLKVAEKKDASKTEMELLRLELAIAKAKRKARKAGAAITKIHIKQWIKANSKHEKSYKLTLEEEDAPVAEAVEEVKTKRKYTRRDQDDTSQERAILADGVTEGKAGISASIDDDTRDLAAEPVKKERKPRRSSAEVAAEKEAARAALRELGDDFSIIEGVGPSVTTMLHGIGVTTFAALAAYDMEELRAMLKARRNNIADPTTWGQQAQLVVDNDWENLKQLQATLKKTRS